MHFYKEKFGFTLLELSIVLIVIGLIAGGILVGRDLVHTATIRATIKQFEEFNTAVNAFKTKYNCLPGDCVNASDFGFSVNANGNGDGVIGRPYRGGPCWEPGAPILCEAEEYTDFWYHLSAATLIGYSLLDFASYPNNTTLGSSAMQTGVATPPTKLNHIRSSGGRRLGWKVWADAAFSSIVGGGYLPAHLLILGQGYTLPIGFSGFYAPADIWAIDTKIDDGLPFTGSARVGTGGLYTAALGFHYVLDANLKSISGGQPFCVDDTVTPATYNVSYPGNATNGFGNCGLIIKASF